MLTRKEWETVILKNHPDAVFPEWIIERFAGFMVSPTMNLGDDRIATAVARAISSEYTEELGDLLSEIGKNAFLFYVRQYMAYSPVSRSKVMCWTIKYAMIPK